MSNIFVDVLGRKFNKKEMIKMAETSLKGNSAVVSDISIEYDKICEKLFDGSSKFYLNPTERLVLKNYVKEGDTVATVLGSGDFAIESAFNGAKNITTFDINVHQYPVAMLKLIGLEQLGYDDYWDFFSNVNSENFLSPAVYKKIKNNDKNVIFSFWDILMQERKSELEKLSKNSLYNMLKSTGLSFVNEATFNIICDQKISKVLGSILGPAGEKFEGSYLENQHNYEIARQKIQEVEFKFVKSDLTKLRSNLLNNGQSVNDAFDMIYISNIPEYFPAFYFFKIVSEQLFPLLKEDGSIVYCCQGIKPDTLLKNGFNPDREKADNMADEMRLHNSIEAYNHLKLRGIPIEVAETVPTYGGISSDSSVDTYVKIKKIQ